MNNFNDIDFDLVKEEVAKYAFIDEAKNRIINEEVNYNPLVIKKKLLETKEAINLLNNGFILNFDGIIDIKEILDKSKKNIILTTSELSNVLVFHNHAERIQNIVKNIDKELSIKDYVESIILDKNMYQRLDAAIDAYGNLKNTASKKLADILASIDRNDKQIYNEAHEFINQYKGSLQEDSLYMRNNRITFLVKNSDKNKYQGYHYGTSASGQATYVEPGKFVEYNNKKLALEDEKEEEIKRILKELSELVSYNADYYANNYESIVCLNIIFAKANYGFSNHAIIPEINNENYDLVIKDVCHPLIDKNTVISNTYRLIEPYKGIVISGTNTGGKTVGLKTIGLTLLMTYIGIPIIAESALIPLYKSIYLDIDDKQSVLNSLSTFSAHISNINYILNNADNKTLILIDELISGTDPKEAQAISLAILEEIEKINAYFVITTHYDEIKNYAYKKENIMLSAVGFDLEKLIPTYKYYENTVGISNAIDIASRYFDNPDIISNANNYLKIQSKKEDELMNRLSNEISEYEKRNDELSKVLNDNNLLNEELNSKLSSFENDKKVLKDKYLKELNDYISDIKEKAENVLKEIKETKNNKEIVKIKELINEDYVDEPVTFDVGDNCKVGTGDQIGEIIDIKGNNVKVVINGLIVNTKLNNLTKMPKQIKKIKYQEHISSNKNVAKEINLIGNRVEESLPLIDHFLDNALMNGVKTVKIIHGVGTGKLRSGIREHLKKNKFIKTFKDGDVYDGLSAVTIVEFK